MAQADYVTTATPAPITGVGTKRSTSAVRAAHAEFVTGVAKNPPWRIPLFPHPTDLEDRADHLKKVLEAFSVYVTELLNDTAENIPGGLDLRQVDALLSDLTSEVTGIVQGAADATPWRGA